MKYVIGLILYGLAGWYQRGWFDIYGLLTVSLLVIPLAMSEPKRKKRSKDHFIR